MKNAAFISQLPNVPAVYALYGGQGSRSYVAYVGITDQLRRRIEQHLVRRDSSVATGTYATGINPDYITQVRWWEHPRFSDKKGLRAAEVVADDILNPSLRSRGGLPKDADHLLEDQKFKNQMTSLFTHEPSGLLTVATLQDALEKISHLEKRVAQLERKLPKN